MKGVVPMRNYDLSPLLRQWIGFDKLASSMGGQEPQGFPPFNIEKAMTITTVFLWRWPVSGRAN
jgi:hypothetical protein